MLTPFLGVKHSTRTGGGALRTGVDGPRPGAGRSATWNRGLGSLPDGRTVRACAGAAKVADGAWISLSGGTHQGGEILGDVYARQADLDSSNRRRVEEKRRIWGLEY
jgi:hypothetical protein